MNLPTTLARPVGHPGGARPVPPRKAPVTDPSFTPYIGADFELTVYGRPAPQGSKKHVGKGIMVESSQYVKPWRDDVRSGALDLLEQCHPDTPWVPLDGPLRVAMVFTVAKPTSAPKKRRTWPQTMPDLSKLCRSTEDALTSAGVWKDDARVVEYARLAKVYPGEDPAALDGRTGARIWIWRITA